MLPQHIPVAKEGLPFVCVAALAAVIFALLEWSVPAVIALLITAFVVYFFRDPERIIPPGTGFVVSPADGRVIEVVDSAEGSLQGTDVRRISIFMNVFNVHVNRAPVGGTVAQISYKPGSFWPADRNKALLKNEQNAVLLKSEDGVTLTVVQVAGLIARRIVCWVEVGDTVKKGERFGMIRFGSRLDVYLPREAAIMVKKGERVWAGQTVIASSSVPPVS